jgi:hypothetical protein
MAKKRKTKVKKAAPRKPRAAPRTKAARTAKRKTAPATKRKTAPAAKRKTARAAKPVRKRRAPVAKAPAAIAQPGVRATGRSIEAEAEPVPMEEPPEGIIPVDEELP